MRQKVVRVQDSLRAKKMAFGLPWTGVRS